MPNTLRGINQTPYADSLSALSERGLSTVTIAAGVVTTTVQDALIVPFNYKIRKIAVMYTAADVVDGTEVFNLVVGGLKGATAQAYTSTNVAANDNRDIYGYPTNVAVAGNSVFNGNVGISNAASYAYSATVANSASNPGMFGPGGGFIGTGWVSATTTGGYGVFIPYNYDAVYPLGTPLSLRMSSTASTGAIANFSVTLAIVPIALRYIQDSVAGQIQVQPGIDF